MHPNSSAGGVSHLTFANLHVQSHQFRDFQPNTRIWAAQGMLTKYAKDVTRCKSQIKERRRWGKHPMIRRLRCRCIERVPDRFVKIYDAKLGNEDSRMHNRLNAFACHRPPTTGRKTGGGAAELPSDFYVTFTPQEEAF